MNSKLIPATAFIIAMGIVFAYVGPTWSGPIAETKAAIKADEDALHSSTSYIEQLDQLSKQQSAINQDGLKRLSLFLPDSVDNVRLILDLNTLAARSGVSLSNIDVSANRQKDTSGSANVATSGSVPAPDSEIVDSADLSLTAVGTYSAFKIFLSGLEKSARLLDVRNLAVSGSDTGVYTYQMMIRFYWLH